jgi:hypothetical protein
VKVLKVFFAGEGNIEAAGRYLDECAHRYNRVITEVAGIRLNLRTLQRMLKLKLETNS